VSALVARLRALRQRRLDGRARAVCPGDSWAFTPLYTGGACPLCGWAPEGYTHTPPPLSRYERYWGAMAAIAAASALMLVVVVVAATRG
jgi:hypothetical protein